MRVLGVRRRSGVAASLVAAFMFAGAGVSAASDVGTQSYSVSCFGNVGTFRDGSAVLGVAWSSDVPECFGIAPSGTIWHTWQGAGAWFQMPGNGRAIDTVGGFEWGSADRTVIVTTGPNDYCQDYLSGSGWTGSWYRC